MKTILLITTVFPPQNTIGAQRTYSFAKHLSELGHKVHVITTVKTAIDGDLNYYPDCSMFQLDEFSYLPKKKLSEAPGENSTSEVKKRLSLIKRILRSARRLIFGNLIDVHDPFVFKAFSFADQLIKDKKIDVVLSSFGPTAPHYLAMRLKKSNPELFWMADYRDLWSDNHLLKPIFPFSYLQYLVEKTVISDSDQLITVSKPWAQKLQKAFNKPVETVTNGYFVEDLPLHQELNNTDQKIRFVYTGVFYPHKHDLTPFFQAMQQLLDEKEVIPSNIEISFYGPDFTGLQQQILDAKIDSSLVKIHPSVPREQAVRLQQTSSALLFLQWKDDEDGLLPGKIFEYIIANRPIIGVGLDISSEAGKLIQMTQTGWLCSDIDSIKRSIIKVANNELPTQNTKIIDEYRRDTIAKKLSSIIENSFNHREETE